jgi:hypothetical protein
MTCKANHICSMRCSDICACPCDQAYHNVATDCTSPVLVASSNTLVTQSIPATSVNLAMRPAAQILDYTQASNVSAWQKWDALSSDREVEQSQKPSPTKGPAIREVYRNVGVLNGARQTGPSNASSLHNTIDCSNQIEQRITEQRMTQQLKAISGPTQPNQNGHKGFINPSINTHDSASPNTSPKSGTYAAAAREALRQPLPSALNLPCKINYSIKATRSTQMNNQSTYNKGQDTNKSPHEGSLASGPSSSHSRATQNSSSSTEAGSSKQVVAVKHNPKPKNLQKQNMPVSETHQDQPGSKAPPTKNNSKVKTPPAKNNPRVKTTPAKNNCSVKSPSMQLNPDLASQSKEHNQGAKAQSELSPELKSPSKDLIPGLEIQSTEPNPVSGQSSATLMAQRDCTKKINGDDAPHRTNRPSNSNAMVEQGYTKIINGDYAPRQTDGPSNSNAVAQQYSSENVDSDHIPDQSDGSSDSNGSSATTLDSHEQDEIPIGDEDLISFD